MKLVLTTGSNRADGHSRVLGLISHRVPDSFVAQLRIFFAGFTSAMSESQASDSLNDVHETVSSVYHDLNNPLSIISGNAQFLLEISREEELDDQFVSSAQDIKEAAQRMADSLHKLTRLKEQIKEEQ